MWIPFSSFFAYTSDPSWVNSPHVKLEISFLMSIKPFQTISIIHLGQMFWIRKISHIKQFFKWLEGIIPPYVTISGGIFNVYIWQRSGLVTHCGVRTWRRHTSAGGSMQGCKAVGSVHNLWPSNSSCKDFSDMYNFTDVERQIFQWYSMEYHL